jgi:hypothetical protein
MAMMNPANSVKFLKYAALALITGLFFAASLSAVPNGPGGGGGHGGGGGGHSGGGFSSAHSAAGSRATGGTGVGHAIGHSFGRLFGHPSKSPTPASEFDPSLGTSRALRGNFAPVLPSRFAAPRPAFTPVSGGGRFPHRPIGRFPFGNRFFFFPGFFSPGFGFGFGGCGGFGFLSDPFFFNGGFNCFNDGFSFDPFLFGGYSGYFASTPAFPPMYNSWPDYVPNDSGAESRTGQSSDDALWDDELWSGSGSSQQNPASGDVTGNATGKGGPSDQAQSDHPVTLLVLRDGSMYGLVDYWVADGQLHYTTTYGGQNSVALNRIDLEKTMQLNAERGIHFVLSDRHP